MKLGWEAMGSGVMCEGSPYRTVQIDVSLATVSNMSKYHKWSLTICDGCFDTLNSSKMCS